ncbi:DUF5959 family protein [Streptomyces sp. NBC_01013]|nr:DUF5959 family protein [Streptomyces sp. NBC_01013]
MHSDPTPPRHSISGHAGNAQFLDALEAAEGTEWPPGGRSAWLSVVPEDPLEVTVHDSPSTQIAVQIPVDVSAGWLEDNRLRLGHVRKAIAKRCSAAMR